MVNMKPHPHVLKDPTLSEMWDLVHEFDRNLLIAVIGRPGSGKSYTAIRMGELFDEKFRNVSTPEEAQHIVDTRVITEPKGFAKVIAEDKSLGDGSVLIIDEAGVVLPYESWQSLENRLTSYILQSFRNRHLITIFCLPSLKFLSVQARRMLHYVIEVYGVNKREKQTVCKLKAYQPNAETGKIYQHKMRHIVNDCRTTYSRFVFDKPGQLVCNAYENVIAGFKDNIVKSVNQQLSNIELKEKQKEEASRPFDYKSIAKEVITKYKAGELSKITSSAIHSLYPELSVNKSDTVRVTVNRLLEHGDKQ